MSPNAYRDGYSQNSDGSWTSDDAEVWVDENGVVHGMEEMAATFGDPLWDGECDCCGDEEGW